MPVTLQDVRFCTSLDGTRIAYEVSGKGPPLVWAQLWTHHLRFDLDSPVWRPWLALLAHHHTLVRFDWRGCGLSDRDNVSFSLDKFVEDFEAVVDAAGLQEFDAFGMAGGATVATLFAIRRPQAVKRLVLYGCQSRGRIARANTRELIDESETRLKVIEIGWPNATPAYGQFFTALHMPDSSPAQFSSLNRLIRNTSSPANVIQLLRALWEADVHALLPRIGCPTLVLHARQDAIVPFEEGRMVAALVPGARLVPLESRNHILLDTEPAWRQFVDAFDAFLSPAPSDVPVVAGAVLRQLTPREHQVLELIAQGLDYAGIASQLDLTAKTVRNQASTIFSKLGVSSRAQAIAFARDAGFGRRSGPH